MQFKGNSLKEPPSAHNIVNSSTLGSCQSCGESHRCNTYHVRDAKCCHYKCKYHIKCVCCQKFTLSKKKWNKQGMLWAATSTVVDLNGISAWCLPTAWKYRPYRRRWPTLYSKLFHVSWRQTQICICCNFKQDIGILWPQNHVPFVPWEAGLAESSKQAVELKGECYVNNLYGSGHQPVNPDQLVDQGASDSLWDRLSEASWSGAARMQSRSSRT